MPQIILLGLALLGVNAQMRMGGFSEAEDKAKVAKLASFALASIHNACEGSNTLGCGRFSSPEVQEVVNARTQVVAGTNYDISVRTVSGQTIAMRIFEQIWTGTLQVTSATLANSAAGASFAIESIPLIEDGAPLSLDPVKFASFSPQ